MLQRSNSVGGGGGSLALRTCAERERERELGRGRGLDGGGDMHGRTAPLRAAGRGVVHADAES